MRHVHWVPLIDTDNPRFAPPRVNLSVDSPSRAPWRTVASRPGFPVLAAPCSRVPPRCARRSRRFSRPQQLDPQSVLQACCILQPIPGLFWFRGRLASMMPLLRGSTASSTSSRPDAPPPVLYTLQSLPPIHSLPLHAGAEPSCTFSPGLTATLASDFSAASPAFTTRLAFSSFPDQRLLPPAPPLLSD